MDMFFYRTNLKSAKEKEWQNEEKKEERGCRRKYL